MCPMDTDVSGYKVFTFSTLEHNMLNFSRTDLPQATIFYYYFLNTTISNLPIRFLEENNCVYLDIHDTIAY